MKRIELIKGISSSVIGFGCAPVKGSVSSGVARTAIEYALDRGINHFDLARSYGYGEAERFVGKILKHKRTEIVLASKFGIKANLKSRILAPFKPLVRFGIQQIKRKNEKTENNFATQLNTADKFHYRVALTKFEMRKSLDQSLRALDTEYLDYYFIHEPISTLEAIDDIIDCSIRLKEEGKIRAFGISFMRSQEYMHQKYLHLFDLIQFDNSPGAFGYEQAIHEKSNLPSIIFSPLKGGNNKIKATDKLKQLTKDFPRSVILCSMFDKAHIENNTAIFS